MAPSVRRLKRLMDIAGSVVGIGLTLPLYVPIGAAILLESGGPVFFVQRRAGRLEQDRSGAFHWLDFDMFKFRTMHNGAESATGAILAAEDDVRATRVGSLLRRTRLDEIPQLWNVLRGDMSLIGPRPERPEILAVLVSAIPYFEQRTRGVKPGLTGLAQISLDYGGEPEPDSEAAPVLKTLANPFQLPEAEGAVADGMRNKLIFDLAYAAALEDFWSYVRLELKILVKTPVIMVTARGR